MQLRNQNANGAERKMLSLSILYRKQMRWRNLIAHVNQMPKIENEKTWIKDSRSYALTLFNKCMCNMGPINMKTFIFRNNEYDLTGFNKLHQPAHSSRFMHRSYLYVTSRVWNNLLDCVRRAPSLITLLGNAK